jgi:addiction module RelE/StbE family toxin
MAFKIIWSLQAREDLRDIVRFVAQHNASAAETLGYSLISRVDSLEQFPLLGRAVPELGDPGVREIILRPYRIIYRVFDEQRLIAIVRVWHGARGEPAIPSEPLP